jgi:hypothetical protein
METLPGSIISAVWPSWTTCTAAPSELTVATVDTLLGVAREAAREICLILGRSSAYRLIGDS